MLPSSRPSPASPPSPSPSPAAAAELRLDAAARGTASPAPRLAPARVPPLCLGMLAIYATVLALTTPAPLRPWAAPLVLLPMAWAAWTRSRRGAVVLTVLALVVHYLLWPAELWSGAALAANLGGHLALLLLGVGGALAIEGHRRGVAIEGILAALPAGLVLVDRETARLVGANGAARRLLGLDLAAPIEGPVTSLIAPEVWAQAVTGELAHCELRVDLRGPAAAARRVALQAMPVVLGARARVLLALRDIETQEALEEELVAAEQARGQAAVDAQVGRANHLAQLGTVAAGVGHEINNPLAYMLINLELAASERLPAIGARVAGLPDAARAEAEAELAELGLLIDETQAGATQIHTVVRQLQQFSRTSSDPQTPTDIAEFAGRAAQMAAHSFPSGLDFHHHHSGPRRARCAPSKLSQVVINLLTNAAHAVAGSARAEVRLETAVDDRGIHLAVADTGCGIPADQLSRIFDPFYTTKPVGQGTGLGLAVCRSIVEGEGGQLTVDSTEGVGTTVRIFLPAAAVPAPEDAAAAPGAAAGPRSRASSDRLRVLVVDDQQVIRDAVRRLLAPHFEVTTAASGAAALACLETATFDRILLDLAMPDMTGQEVYAQVLARAPETAARMVFFTGGVVDTTLRAFADIHRQRVIHKPVGADLVHRLRAPLPPAPPPQPGGCALRCHCALYDWFRSSPTNQFYQTLYCDATDEAPTRCHRQRHLAATGVRPPDDLLPDGRRLGPEAPRESAEGTRG